MKILKYWFPLIFWCGLIFYLSSLPRPLPEFESILELIISKLGHIIEYFILTIFLFRVLKNSTNLRAKNVYSFCLIFSIFYATTDEFHQTFVPNRHGKFHDILIDTIGVLIALYLIRKKFDNSLKN
jgi:VanZ family protein